MNVREYGRRAAVLALACASMAHVGSPDTFFTGQAGPYAVRVSVRLPGVIPGLAQIAVRIPGVPPDAIARVSVRAIQWNVGPEGAPPADVAQRVPGDAELYASDLWFMAPTSYRVHVEVEGRDGKGTAVVPVLALATAQREMPRSMGVVLSALGLFLGVGLLTIVGAAVRESVVPPGDAPEPSRRRRARFATAVGAAVLGLVAAGGWAWWTAEAFAYGESVLYRPFSSTASIRAEGASRVLTLTIADRRWPPAPGNALTRYNSLMPDHGKLMHMFLIREPALDAFAHVHPVAREAATAFDVRLPPLPRGRYRVYGDIVHESGYAQTLMTSVELDDPPASPAAAGDADDSWFGGAAVAESVAAIAVAGNGTTIVWERGAQGLAEGKERVLRFLARDAAGAPASLEPYMGMIGHVVVARVDGDVFAHLHPSGSVSMAALQKFTATIDPHAAHQPQPAAGEVSTLYAFPREGRYRIWVQMKQSGQPITAAFDVQVQGSNRLGF
jgi:hypothetical protein